MIYLPEQSRSLQRLDNGSKLLCDNPRRSGDPPSRMVPPGYNTDVENRAESSHWYERTPLYGRTVVHMNSPIREGARRIPPSCASSAWGVSYPETHQASSWFFVRIGAVDRILPYSEVGGSVVYRGSQYTKLPLSLAAAKNKFYISQREARTDREPGILFWAYASQLYIDLAEGFE
ncbi:hypothetical protein BDN71DRAFT_1426482 [Pleurotus eryngii]|uniref:Uncharacterized protein n=1 Tax=Pleurotus eryngii TaxID=5323 RepID=A0A9P6DC79_PLEER|nr:hypothetical protein BDN71DRAFT_1426482 [Pleurotus eryngii]